MADFKDNMYRRLRSAGQWLKRAEESFDKDRDVRAELDLMLAQAELQHAKEASRTRHWRYKYSLLTQGAAAVMAMVIAVVGFGGAYWWFNQHRTSDNQTPAVVSEPLQSPQHPAAVSSLPEQPKVQQLPSEAIVKPVSASTTGKSEHPPKLTAAENRVKDDDGPYRAEKEVVLPPDELQKLVRAAGKSLRGQ
ncbi:hypothetical protein SDC9_160422 [bioreactor metagenome]|uniref:Uncharacterized protein n=1 Tax=bioreactor metagenome TaxID=1076179 RepID=A0A645FHV2_9ZZZZ